MLPPVGKAAMTPDEAAQILRRAAEIQAAADLHEDDALDAAAVVRLGSELGLREDAVRTALQERRGGLPASAAGGRRVLGLDAEVLVERHVALSAEAVQAGLGMWLRGQWMQRQRNEPGRTTWRPRRGPVADLRRGLDLLRTLELKGVGAVEVRTTSEDAGSRVSVVLSLSGTRTEALVGLVAFPAGAVGSIAALVVLLGTPEALLAMPLAGAAGGAGWLGARAAVQARRRQVAEVVERVLDDLQRG